MNRANRLQAVSHHHSDDDARALATTAADACAGRHPVQGGNVSPVLASLDPSLTCTASPSSWQKWSSSMNWHAPMVRVAGEQKAAPTVRVLSWTRRVTAITTGMSSIAAELRSTGSARLRWALRDHNAR